MTIDTSGPRSPVPFASYDREDSSWSNQQTSLLPSSEPNGSDVSPIWPISGPMRNGRLFAHRTLALPTVDVDSSLLPTPNAGNFNDGEDLESWEERRARNAEKGINGNGQGTPLAIAVRMLPTPTTRDARGRTADGRQGGPGLPTTAKLLGTPNTRDRYTPRPGYLKGSLARQATEIGGESTDPPSDDGKPSSADQHPTLWTTEDD